MHVEEGADAVACAMSVIQADVPKRRSGKGVDLKASGAIGKASPVNGDVRLENERVGLL